MTHMCEHVRISVGAVQRSYFIRHSIRLWPLSSRRKIARVSWWGTKKNDFARRHQLLIVRAARSSYKVSTTKIDGDISGVRFVNNLFVASPSTLMIQSRESEYTCMRNIIINLCARVFVTKLTAVQNRVKRSYMCRHIYSEPYFVTIWIIQLFDIVAWWLSCFISYFW